MERQFDAQAKMFYEFLDRMPTSFLNEIVETLPAYVQTRKFKFADELLEGKQKMLRREKIGMRVVQ